MIMGGEMETVGIRGENAPQMIYRRRQQIEKEINAWFKAFEIPYSLKVKQVGDEVTGEIIAMTLTDRRTDVAVAPSDVGFGIGQLLPILVEGVVAEGRILCVEQPEIHLHPRLQAHVADLLIKTAGLRPLSERGQQSSRIGNQWIVETHSEALILRLQRRIREKKISHEDISVLYIEPGDKAGSRILHLRLDEDGEFIDEWPGGFFEEGYKEIFGGQDE
jgi:predicted ATPase